MDSFGDSALPQLQKRGLYKKSIESLADAIETISENVQFNSINEIMVPPALSSHQQRVIIRTLCAQSRDKDVDNTVFLIDGMSNRHLKLPRLNDRPKFVTDALRVTMVLTTVQIGEINGANKFSNYDYPGIQNVFSHDSSYILSLFLDGLLKLRAMPSCLTVVLDSAPNNKSYAIIGGMGVILSKIRPVQKIVLLYPSTGHTHLSVDGHFGTLSQSLGNTELMDPTDLISFLENNSSVKDVNAYPTVYDFTGIQERMDKIQNLCSNSQIILSKDEDAFRQTITLLNQKTRKVGITINNNDPTDPHVTILQYLKESGYPTGRIPKNPIIK
ncbi:hypothetical protein CAEBREN_08861 [Caenorhabditis brenneri]|uniref:DUF7869 domain-containing protein n=1 Tax=Caenorhabditis brenneri TaxID=135651 RepID=G0NKI8_CAEBE|nr:hypothetical protein CAEBREN_08861 [Caenorhabditis brenneri]